MADKNAKKKAYLAMAFVVIAWGYEYVAAKNALVAFDPIPLVCVKYLMGLIILAIVKCVSDRRFFIRKKDLPMFIICSVTGELLYYACEYGAMSRLPVSVISIVLAFVPAVSVLTEYLLYKKKANLKIGIGIAVGIVGVAFVIGGDISAFFTGAAFGYILIFGAVFSWNCYNFLTQKLADNYKPLDLTLYQTVCTSLLALPFLLHSHPTLAAITPDVWTGLLFIGFVCEGVGFLFYVNAVAKLGPTPCALFSNMLPVSSTFFGWLCLGERILPMQLVGGAVVIAAGVLVIREKEILERNG